MVRRAEPDAPGASCAPSQDVFDSLVPGAPQIGQLLDDVARLLFKQFGRQVASEARLSQPELWLIIELHRLSRPVSQKQLARIARRTKTAVGMSVTRLQKRGYVERGPDAMDRRVKQVELSPDGIDLVRWMFAMALGRRPEFGQGIEPRQVEFLVPALTAVTRNLAGMCTRAAGEDVPPGVWKDPGPL